MKTLMRVLRVELRRSLTSATLWLQLVLLLAWMCLNILAQLLNPNLRGFEPWQMLVSNAVTDIMNFAPLLMAIGPVCYAWSYCSDHICGYDLEAVRRTGTAAYGVAKFLAAMLSTFAVTVLAVLVFAGIMGLLQPPMNTELLTAGNGAYLELVAEGSTALFLVCRAAITGLSAAFAAALALAVSAYVKNSFVSILSPLLIYMVLDNLSLYPDPRLSWQEIMFFETGKSTAASAIWAIWYLLLMIAGCGLLFVHRIRKELSA